MATSGSFNTSAYSNRYLTFSWSVKSTSIANNQTTISWSIAGGGSASKYYLTQNITLKLDGEVVWEHLKADDGQIKLYNGTSVASGTYTFTHANDGSKDFTAYLEAGIYVWEPNCSASKTFSLDDIPREATITSAPNFNDEANPVLKYSNPAGSAVDTLQACIASSDGATIYCAYRDISKSSTSYTFSLTTAERNALRNATPNSNTMSVRFYIKTIIGDNTFKDYATKTLTIVNANPTVSPTVWDSGENSTVLSGDADNIVIKGFNVMNVEFGATAHKGATIKSKKVVCGSQSLTADGKMSYVDSNVFKFTVVDSRGNTTTKEITKTLVDYKKITCKLENTKFTTDGVISFTISGTFWSGNFGAVDNALDVKYKLYEKGGSGDWITTSPTINTTNHTYSVDISVSGLDYKTRYEIVAYGLDSAYRVYSPYKTMSCVPVFDWDKDDFNFNVSVNMPNGKAIRGYTSDDELKNMMFMTTANLVSIGGGSAPPAGIKLTTEDGGNIALNGINYGVNNLLASPGKYMNASQTVSFSSPVSAQAHGIVLVFSYYNNSALQNEQFVSHFVPKGAVSKHGGCGFSFSLNSHWYNGMKYLYISDNEITGHENNSGDFTVGGITYNNSKFVLRYVYGV